ncbi:hypothetical protein MRX96_047858 [Rhipicephalus microplus]
MQPLLAFRCFFTHGFSGNLATKRDLVRMPTLCRVAIACMLSRDCRALSMVSVMSLFGKEALSFVQVDELRMEAHSQACGIMKKNACSCSYEVFCGCPGEMFRKVLQGTSSSGHKEKGRGTSALNPCVSPLDEDTSRRSEPSCALCPHVSPPLRGLRRGALVNAARRPATTRKVWKLFCPEKTSPRRHHINPNRWTCPTLSSSLPGLAAPHCVKTTIMSPMRRSHLTAKPSEEPPRLTIYRNNGDEDKPSRA